MRSLRLVVVGLLAAGGLVACGGDDEAGETGTTAGTVTIYSGRNEALIRPLLDRFSAETGIKVETRYAGSAELAAALLEEGDRAKADVFLSQDSGALGAVAKAGALKELPGAQLDKVDERFRADNGTWVGLSGRARVIVHDPAELPEAEIPDSVFDLTDEKWKGRVAYAPTNASFQAFVTGMRVLEGDDRTEQWLRDFLANGAKAYENNIAILDAIDAGQIDIGIANHYYALEKKAENPAFKVTNHFLDGEDPGALINVAGVGVLDPTPEATRLVDYLLSAPAQQYFASETFEYPLAAGVAPPTGLPSLDEIDSPDVDLSRLDDLEATLKLLDEVGAT